MNKKLKQLHNEYHKHNVVHVSSDREGWNKSAVGFCSCGTIYVSNTTIQLSWYSMENQAIGESWRKLVWPVITSNKAMLRAWRALPKCGSGITGKRDNKPQTWVQLGKEHYER
jgi:hypothetical protein